MRRCDRQDARKASWKAMTTIGLNITTEPTPDPSVTFGTPRRGFHEEMKVDPGMGCVSSALSVRVKFKGSRRRVKSYAVVTYFLML